MQRVKTVVQQVIISCMVVWLWRTAEGDPKTRWAETYASADSAVVEILHHEKATDRDMTAGAGFVLRHLGRFVIVTNEHVIRDAESLKVRFRDSVLANADVTDSSPLSDLAIIRVQGVNLERYGPLSLGNSADLQIGDELMTIGHPLRESHHLSIGLYAGKERIEEIGTLLRLSMPVDPGNSGGPLLDSRGRVVGIVSLKVRSASSMALAIPIEVLQKLGRP